MTRPTDDLVAEIKRLRADNTKLEAIVGEYHSTRRVLDCIADMLVIAMDNADKAPIKPVLECIVVYMHYALPSETND